MSRHTLRANPGSSARSAASRVASRKSQGRSARMPFHFQASQACASTASCWSSHRQRAATCGADATDSVSTRVALRAHRPPSPSATPGKAAHLCVLDGLLRERMRGAGVEDEESRLLPCSRQLTRAGGKQELECVRSLPGSGELHRHHRFGHALLIAVVGFGARTCRAPRLPRSTRARELLPLSRQLLVGPADTPKGGIIAC